MISSIN